MDNPLYVRRRGHRQFRPSVFSTSSIFLGRREELDGDDVIESRVARFVDLAHGAGADQPEDFKRPETLAHTETAAGFEQLREGRRFTEQREKFSEELRVVAMRLDEASPS